MDIKLEARVLVASVALIIAFIRIRLILLQIRDFYGILVSRILGRLGREVGRLYKTVINLMIKSYLAGKVGVGERKYYDI